MNIDTQALNAVRSLRVPFLDAVMPFITMLGDAGIFWILVAAVLCCFAKTRKTGVLMIVALAVTFVVSTLGLKLLFARPRPCVQFQDALFYPCPSGFSFPSGHSIASFAAAGVLFFRHEKGRVAALVLAALIAFSRVYLYVHFPSDVLAGSGLGLLTAYVLVKAEAKRKPVI